MRTMVEGNKSCVSREAKPRSNAYAWWVHIIRSDGAVATWEFDTKEEAISAIAPVVARSINVSPDTARDFEFREIAMLTDGIVVNKWRSPTYYATFATWDPYQDRGYGYRSPHYDNGRI